MVHDSTNYGHQYKDGALRETPLAVLEPVTSNRYKGSLIMPKTILDWTVGTISNAGRTLLTMIKLLAPVIFGEVDLTLLHVYHLEDTDNL